MARQGVFQGQATTDIRNRPQKLVPESPELPWVLSEPARAASHQMSALRIRRLDLRVLRARSEAQGISPLRLTRSPLPDRFVARFVRAQVKLRDVAVDDADRDSERPHRREEFRHAARELV